MKSRMKGGENVEEVFYPFSSYFVLYLFCHSCVGWAKIFFKE
jgi:hypothetical protein